MSWLDAFGWFGSAFVIYSLLQARMLRFRVLNSVACSLLALYNGLLAVWPMVAMNLALVAINTYFIVGLIRDRRNANAYAVLSVAGNDAFLRHFLTVEADDITRFFPGFQGMDAAEERTAYLILKGYETAGVVIVKDAGEGLAIVEVDYVTPKYRDFTPGEFVYLRSGLFVERGFTRIHTLAGIDGDYYGRLGFARVADHWEATVP